MVGALICAPLLQPATVDATASPTPSAIPPPPSSIGPEAVFSIAVSPEYEKTGLVVAVAHPLAGCKNPCGRYLWISHNGGANWGPARGTGWSGQPAVIVRDPDGHEVLFASGSAALQRSDDYGTSWKDVPGTGAGSPQASPTYATDATLAVASAPDYLLRKTTVRAVAGSGGAIADERFFYMAAPSAKSAYPPVLLGGLDKQTSLPVIQRCTADFQCSGYAGLPGATSLGGPAVLHPSSTYTGDGVVFAQVGAGIYKSSNGGSTFLQLNMALPPATNTATPALVLAPGYSEHGSNRTAYASVLQIHTEKRPSSTTGGVYATADGGTTWHRLGSPSPLDGGSTFVTVAPDGRLFAGYLGTSTYADGGLLCSEDHGATWQPRCSSVGTWAQDHGGTGAAPAPSSPCSGPSCGSAGGSGASIDGQATSPSTDGTKPRNSTKSPDGRLLGAAKNGSTTSRLLAVVAGGVSVCLGLLACASMLLRRRRARSST
jgi:hypothetical protein